MFKMMKMCAMAVRPRIKSFLEKENGEVNIVAIVILIGIAVFLAIIFRNGIANLLGELFDAIGTRATDAINESPG